MPLFRYHAIHRNGQSQRGVMLAPNAAELEIRLARIGQDLITCTSAYPWQRRSRVPLTERIIFCQNMQYLLNAGVPLLEALAEVRDTLPPSALHTLLTAILAEVESGRALSEALADYPATFGPVAVSLIQAGEASGQLAQAFSQLAAWQQWQAEILSRLMRSLLYPVFLLVMVLLVGILLMHPLLPQIVGFLGSLGQTPPFSIRLLMALSAHASLLGMLLLALTLGIAALWHAPFMRYRVDRWRLSLPIVGRLQQQAMMAKFSHCLALLYRAGVPFMQALTICRTATGNRIMTEHIDQIHQRIAHGQSLGDSFQACTWFPALVVRMIRIGEKSGALEQSLMNAATFYEQQFKASVDRTIALLEPALTVASGLLMAGMMLSMLGPIYESLGKLT